MFPNNKTSRLVTKPLRAVIFPQIEFLKTKTHLRHVPEPLKVFICPKSVFFKMKTRLRNVAEPIKVFCFPKCVFHKKKQVEKKKSVFHEKESFIYICQILNMYIINIFEWRVETTKTYHSKNTYVVMIVNHLH